MTNQSITIKYILFGFLAVFITWLIHEFAHWLTSDLLGYEATMSLNKVSPVDGENPTDWHKVIISASGPIITLAQGILVFFLLKTQHWNKYLYLFLFIAFYMRFLAGLMNFINPNDEGRISLYFKMGTFTLPLIVSGFLFLLIYKTSKKYHLKGKFQFWTTLIVMVASSILILSDQFFGIRIL